MGGQIGQLVIKGVTNGGRKFRPSDWAQRLTTAVASRGPGGRIHFHPRVHMVTIDGINSVVVDQALADEEPMLFGFLRNFGRDNDLQMVEQ